MIIHCSLVNDGWFRGNVTYSDADEAEKAINFLESELDPEVDLPYNVDEIVLKPARVESATTQESFRPSGVTIIVSWFPLPARGIAYIKCRNEDTIAILENFNRNMASNCKRPFVTKSGDIGLSIQETDDEFTVWQNLESCCSISQVKSVSKVTVPSKPLLDIKLEEEKKKLTELMEDFGATKVINIWVANKKVCARVLFKDLGTAEGVIEELNGEMEQIGVRAVYLELEDRAEVMCDGRMFEKIRKEIEALKKDEVAISYEQCGRRKKIIVTGDDPKVR